MMLSKVIKPLLIGCIVIIAIGQSGLAEVGFSQVRTKGGQLSFDLSSTANLLVLTVSGPGVYLQEYFSSHEEVSMPMVDMYGQPLPDGTYKYELRTESVTDEGLVKQAESSGDDQLLRQLWEDAWQQSEVQSGSFKITNGQIVIDTVEEE